MTSNQNSTPKTANAPKGAYGHIAPGSATTGSSQEARPVTKKVTMAEAKRRMREIVEAAETYPEIPDAVRRYIVEYQPRIATPEEWDLIEPTFREVLLRTGIKTDGAIRVHTTALAAYLTWRKRESLSLAVADAMKFPAIDQYYLHGAADLSPRTRNDYRSRLQTQARRVAPGVDAPVTPELGYNAVKVGYTEVEEAMLRRVSLKQRRPETRRRLCAVVGFGGGCGIDPQDLRHVFGRSVTVSDEGIFVAVEGPRPRTVVVRRAYEALVLVAIKGVKKDEPVLKLGRDKVNPVARVIEDAELFDDVPKVDMRRLRTTWITWLVKQPIPLNVVLAASGLTSARTIVDMIDALRVDTDFALLRDGGAK